MIDHKQDCKSLNHQITVLLIYIQTLTKSNSQVGMIRLKTKGNLKTRSIQTFSKPTHLRKSQNSKVEDKKFELSSKMKSQKL